MKWMPVFIWMRILDLLGKEKIEKLYAYILY